VRGCYLPASIRAEPSFGPPQGRWYEEPGPARIAGFRDLPATSPATKGGGVSPGPKRDPGGGVPAPTLSLRGVDRKGAAFGPSLSPNLASA
jgi:hypothetical protein